MVVSMATSKQPSVVCHLVTLCEAWAQNLQTSLGEPHGQPKPEPSFGLLDPLEHSIAQQGPRSTQGLDDQAPSSLQPSLGLPREDEEPQEPHKAASSSDVPVPGSRPANAVCPCSAENKAAITPDLGSEFQMGCQTHEMSRWGLLQVSWSITQAMHLTTGWLHSTLSCSVMPGSCNSAAADMLTASVGLE